MPFLILAQMKKGRPGVLLQVIATPDKREELDGVLFRETTTLGGSLPREQQRRVQPPRLGVCGKQPHGAVRVKKSRPEGFEPEYEDARQLAAATGVPLKGDPDRGR